MKIYSPESWLQIPGIDYGAASILLSAVLPKSGQSVSAYFSSRERMPVGDVASILWCPPFSALNGWSEQPSEIAHSFLVLANIVRVSSDQHQQRYDLEVISIEPLLPKLKALYGMGVDWEMPSVLDTRTVPPTVFLTWDEVTWCGVADIDGLKYIVANTSAEAHMELIVDEVDGALFGLFFAHSDPGGSSCNIGRRKLTTEECRAVRGAMQKSVQLLDSYTPYLIM